MRRYVKFDTIFFSVCSCMYPVFAMYLVNFNPNVSLMKERMFAINEILHI